MKVEDASLQKSWQDKIRLFPMCHVLPQYSISSFQKLAKGVSDFSKINTYNSHMYVIIFGHCFHMVGKMSCRTLLCL